MTIGAAFVISCFTGLLILAGRLLYGYTGTGFLLAPFIVIFGLPLLGSALYAIKTYVIPQSFSVKTEEFTINYYVFEKDKLLSGSVVKNT